MKVKLNGNKFLTPEGERLTIQAARLTDQVYVSAGWGEDHLFLILPVFSLIPNEMEVTPIGNK